MPTRTILIFITNPHSLAVVSIGRRVTENVKQLFECFCEVAAPVGDREAWLLQKFPEAFSDHEILKSVPKFAYPCEFENIVVQHFSFVLTSIDSKWTFGFCRHDPKTETALVVLSALPWHETFYKLLNHIATLTTIGGDGDLWKFLGDVYKSGVPLPGASIAIPSPDPNIVFVCQSPKQFQLPSIPENRNLTEYYSAVDSHNMMMIFSSMLYERRIIFTSKKLSRLSACVQACNALIYPMIWQHIYIPVLPLALMDYLLAPMPFLIGVPAPILQRVRKTDLGEVVILDADNNSIESPFQDLESLPQDVVTNLRRALRNRPSLLGDGVSRAFLRALVQLTAGYREALTLQQGERITFDQDAFVENRPSSMQPFLRKMLELQIFQQFIEERLHMLNSGLGFSDEFEMEACNYSDKSGSKFRQQYREWTYTMKKEGSAFFRSVKDKANPAVKSAVKSVKDKGKDMRSVYKGIKWKGRSSRNENNMRYQQPRSAPSSPTLDRRPATFSSPSKPPTGFTAATSYRKELRLRNSAVPETSRKQYSPLSPSSPEDTDSPPERLDIDLMHELRDVIFPNTPPVDRTLKPVRSLDSLRSAWSGRLRHGPLHTTNTANPSEISHTSLCSTLDSSSSSTGLPAGNEKSARLISTPTENLLDISEDLTHKKNVIPDASTIFPGNSSLKKPLINFEEVKNVGPTSSHEFVNPTNPFGTQIYFNTSEKSISSLRVESDNIRYEPVEGAPPIVERNLLTSSSWSGSSLLDRCLNPQEEDVEDNVGDPFDTSKILNSIHPQSPLFHSINPKLPLATQPLLPLKNTRHYSAHAKESSSEMQDLIRLDSTNSDDDFDPLLAKSFRYNSGKQEHQQTTHQSLQLPQMGEGLSNPLYPYFLPQQQKQKSSGEMDNQMNTSSSLAEKLGDFDLLQEYGLDFGKFTLQNGATATPPLSSASTSRKPSYHQDIPSQDAGNSIASAFGSSPNPTAVKSQHNWTKFE
ncbi:DENN domain-containing protein 1B isoform X2 [Cephus cinctus]|uniref:DENN domain-containing protein 1B isoform X2 n=1 Tax=Cephus cinctus TaxID=211228 RepID=A0AAJ7W3R9_CEPCN|nr:DENN domain-containing protein 1B isoform X2 [Cephus cinctus]